MPAKTRDMRLDPKGTFSGLPALTGDRIKPNFNSKGSLVFTENHKSKFISQVDLVNNRNKPSPFARSARSGQY